MVIFQNVYVTRIHCPHTLFAIHIHHSDFPNLLHLHCNIKITIVSIGSSLPTDKQTQTSITNYEAANHSVFFIIKLLPFSLSPIILVGIFTNTNPNDKKNWVCYMITIHTPNILERWHLKTGTDFLRSEFSYNSGFILCGRSSKSALCYRGRHDRHWICHLCISGNNGNRSMR
jgi:hypothetical protein